MNLEDRANSFIDSYKEARRKSIELNAIRGLMKQIYEGNKFDTPQKLEDNGIALSSHNRNNYELKNEEETKDLLWDLGILPMVATIPSAVRKEIKIENAILEVEKNVRIYSGRNKIVNETEDYYASLHEGKSLDELSESFLSLYTELKVLEKERDTNNENLLKMMEEEKIKALRVENVGNLRVQEKVTLDPIVIFNSLEGKKELYIKEDGDSRFRLLILPEEDEAILPKDFEILGQRIGDIYEHNEEISESLYIKKRPFNKLIKEGYKAFQVFAEENPEKFFKSLPISRTIIQEYVDKEILDKDFIDEHYQKREQLDAEGNPVKVVNIVPLSVQETRREMFLDKLSKTKLSKEELKEVEDYKAISNSGMLDVEDTDLAF